MIAADSLLPTWGDRLTLIALLAVAYVAVRYALGILSHKHHHAVVSVDCKMDWHNKCSQENCECPCHD